MWVWRSADLSCSFLCVTGLILLKITWWGTKEESWISCQWRKGEFVPSSSTLAHSGWRRTVRCFEMVALSTSSNPVAHKDCSYWQQLNQTSSKIKFLIVKLTIYSFHHKYRKQFCICIFHFYMLCSLYILAFMVFLLWCSAVKLWMLFLTYNI